MGIFSIKDNLALSKKLSDSKHALQELTNKQIKKYRTILPLLTTESAKELEDVLSFMAKIAPKLPETIKYREKFSSLKKEVCESSNKEITQCFEKIDTELESRERSAYIRDMFVNNVWKRTAYFVINPNLFKIPTIMPILQEAVSMIGNHVYNKPLGEIKELYNFKANKDSIDLLQKYIDEPIQKLSNKYFKNYSQFIDESDKDEALLAAQEKFPGLGKNKLRFFEKQQQVEKLDDAFLKYTTQSLQDYIEEILAYNLPHFHDPVNIFYEISIILSILIHETETMDTIYIDFAKEYIENDFEQSYNRKYNISKTGTKSTQESMVALNTTVKKFYPKRAIDEDNLFLLDGFLDRIDIRAAQRSEIKAFFIKRLRNQKEIRTTDLENKFGMVVDTQLEKTLRDMNNSGWNILFTKPEEEFIGNTPTSIENTHTQKKTSPQESQEVSLYDQFDNIITNINTFKWEDIIQVFESFGYIIPNTKAFVKQLEKEFTDSDQTLLFITSLKKEINNIHKKHNNYRTIEITGGHRVIILRDGKIDGVYNHGDYDKRIRNIK